MTKERTDDYRPRFSFEITQEQFNRAETLLSAHGVKKAIFEVILDDVLDRVSTHGEKFITALVSKAATPSELLPSIREANELVERLEKLDE